MVGAGREGMAVWRGAGGVSGAKSVELGQIVLIGLLYEEAQVGAKLGFTAGLTVGLLAGSRAGRGLYDRSAAAATAVVHDPRVRRGASTALHKAGSASASVAGAAARKVKHRGDGDGDEAEADGGEGVNGKGVNGNGGNSAGGGGFRALREGIAGMAHHRDHDGHEHGRHERGRHEHSRHEDGHEHRGLWHRHNGHSPQGARLNGSGGYGANGSGGAFPSAPSVQTKPSVWPGQDDDDPSGSS